jgi:hypothetical protein
MVNIIIPTSSRPSALRTALQSVAHQTAVEEIDQVLVSEHGGSRESEEVCREFPALPITYQFRTPVPGAEHGRIPIRECLQSRLTALLPGSDWWEPNHLANAIEALEARPQAVLYGASHFVVSGESSLLDCDKNLGPWFGSGYATLTSLWELPRMNVLLAGLLGTVAHHSTLVIRTETLRNASYAFDLGSPFANDRVLVFALSSFGSVVLNPIPESFVRWDEAREGFALETPDQIKSMCTTTRWMVETSIKSWDVVAKKFAKRMAACPDEILPELKIMASKEWCLPELTRHIQAQVLV